MAGGLRWDDFARTAAVIAEVGRSRFESSGVAVLATIRADGSPRISPCEVYFVDGELSLGMMWRSRKALDLRADPRIAVCTPVCGRESPEGDVKLYGRVRERSEAALREHFADAQEAAIDWRPPEPFHLFTVDIERAAFIVFGDERRVLRWTPERGEERIRHPDDPAEA